MTLEQQVANLVSATTELTNVVNGELTNVRIENNTFKNNTLNDIDTRFNDFIQGFDEVKFVQDGFTIYVAASGGSSSPQNPVNNQSDPFDTINNAYDFLLKYYWTNGVGTILLLPGTHNITSAINVSHPCLIRIMGANSPVTTSLNNLINQTTNTNRESTASVLGSNASLLVEARNLYQSIIEVDLSVNAFNVGDNLYIANLLIYSKNLNRIATCVRLNRSTVATKNVSFSCSNVVFMYFDYGIYCLCGAIDFKLSSPERMNYFLGNNTGIYIQNVSFTNRNTAIYCAGNVNEGFHSFVSIVSCSNSFFRGNGTLGFFSRVSQVFADSSQFVANGSTGFYQFGGDSRVINSISQNNGAYGYRSDSGVVMAIGSDATTTGNTVGKKLENNAQQGYIIGVNP